MASAMVALVMGISGGISCGSLSLSLLSPGIGGLLNPVAFKGPPFFGAFE